MNKLIKTALALLILPAGSLTAQTVNSLSYGVVISTDMEGNTILNAQMDGTTRKGYIPGKNQTVKETLDGVCKHQYKTKVYSDVQEVTPDRLNINSNQPMEVLFIAGSEFENYRLTIKDEFSNLVTDYSYRGDHSLDISTYKNGVYLIEIASENTGQKHIRKIVKE